MLITLEELKTYLKITDSTNDALLTESIKQSDSFIKSYTGRNLESEDYVEIRDGRGEREVVLRDYPVTSFDSYKYNSGTIGTPVWTDYDSENYGINKEEGILRSYFPMNKGIQNNQLIYTAGYVIIPDDLKRASLKTSSYYYSGAGKSNGTVKKEAVDGASIEYDTTQAIGQEVYTILDKYKVINV